MKTVFPGFAIIVWLWLRVQGSSSQYLEPNCGLTFDSSYRMTHAKPAGLGRYPWMAFLHTPTNFKCAGTLINHWFVLTAAHCFPVTIDLIVRLGEYNRDTPIDRENSLEMGPTQEYYVDTAFRHKLYDNDDYVHDIGLLKLTMKVEYLPHIQPICIMVGDNAKWMVNQYSWFMATGWGRTSEEPNAKTSRTLQELRVNRRKNIDCFLGFQQRLISEQICAGNDDSNLCEGDSGGPQGRMMEIDGEERFVQMGIASYTKTGCRRISILTNVGMYGDWIKQIVNYYGPKDNRTYSRV
ncbi:serine protease grass [Drosophila eugracilis]|uniref:serine protease grass n=1 Tax=Drosophila eugracilis TaxID=29029 RepID=UPI0007E84260|nr:serine protease grass [Drosophila eugracilis]